MLSMPTRFSLPYLMLLPLLLLPNAIASGEQLVELTHQSPVEITPLPEGVALVDFGRVAFGNLQLTPPAEATGTITVHFGEKLDNGRIDRDPPGTVRYNRTKIELRGEQPVIAAPPADPRNTEQDSTRHPPAILTPPEWDVVMPFRWVEIEGWPGELKSEQVIRRAAFAEGWNDDAADFESSDPMLNRIWELCKYSIKATTFAGVYVDGDRERIPYEADAYINQICHYYTDDDVEMARATFDHLMEYGTWPTEWAPHMVFMAHADWLHTGDRRWLAPRYEALKSKTLMDRTGPDGLVRSNEAQQNRDDIVDWPKGERDGYVFTEVNTVVNAFHLEAIRRMIELAEALDKKEDVEQFRNHLAKARTAFQEKLFDSEAELYRDGIGTDHHSLHANLFPLAFGLVPDDKRQAVAEWLSRRGMRCSVYAAQYLLEGLFQNRQCQEAVALITAPNDRSWRHMVESGTTITWEAWDLKYKPNQDWNHAWGAAPANLLPRFILGVEPQEAGWKRASIRPCPAGLSFARGNVPTARGPIRIDWKKGPDFEIRIELPEGLPAEVSLPAPENSQGVFCEGRPVDARRDGSRWILLDDVRGSKTLKVR
jgi:hypothetical protein